MRILKLQTQTLQLENWTLEPGQVWCVLGNNASGKSQLAAALCGKQIAGAVEIESLPKNATWIGFESQQDEYEAELANDDTDFLDRLDYGSTGLELLLKSGCHETKAVAQAERFGVSHLLERGCRVFSSGELRRVQLLAKWLEEPDLLILDEPFDALDASSRADCSELFAQLAEAGQALLLLVNRIDDVAAWVTHLALLHNGKLLLQGSRDSVLSSDTCRQMLALNQTDKREIPPAPELGFAAPSPILIFKNGFARYGDHYQFRDFDWTLLPGEHTLVTGPNGSGKSTLLNLITGDHPQCYANDLRIFGYQRGTGESIWDIKRQIGIVSPSLHRDYRAGGSVETVVVSGYFDSIGLYQQPSRDQKNGARAWLDLFGMLPHASASFRSLSYGQQRLALIARALVKQPPLLILDEPTQGLDDLNRHLVLACMQQLGELERTTLLFVSHREDEHIALFKHHLHFEMDAAGNPRYRIVKLS